MRPHKEQDYFAYILLLSLGVIWGGQFLFNTNAVRYFPPATVAAIRALIGALTLTIAACWIPEKSCTDSRPISLALLFIALAFFEAVLPLFLIVWGQQHIDSSITSVIVASVPMITLLLSIFLSKNRHFTFASGLSIALGFVGIIVLMKPSGSSLNWNNWIYELAIFGGVFSFAIALLLFEKIPHGTPIRSVRNILWIASLPLTIAAAFLDKPWKLHWNLDGMIALLILGTAASGLAYVLYGMLIQRSGPIFASISNFIVPLVGVFLGIIVCGDHFGAKEVAALVLIIAALAAYNLNSLSKSKS
ncbi:MAG: EamA/RhaT family transporter [Verrucomicrobia bacterium]|nr:MAG: EamA/RhaT family transporter [Verrucomicrobiota bacterium]